ncbi:Uncharacterized protein TCM_012972 [Theobroma cacao]|uniref:Uncharacterized protein n=1 Tax=Theobroma cacao TaxID=3641 RepID=A0A061FWI2_THECC|nr:Uncharacterized protein TCM_012972 [Theobroma cacao]
MEEPQIKKIYQQQATLATIEKDPSTKKNKNTQTTKTQRLTQKKPQSNIKKNRAKREKRRRGREKRRRVRRR